MSTLTIKYLSTFAILRCNSAFFQANHRQLQGKHNHLR